MPKVVYREISDDPELLQHAIEIIRTDIRVEKDETNPFEYRGCDEIWAVVNPAIDEVRSAIGMAGSPDEGIMDLKLLATSYLWRGQGLGRGLIELANGRAADRGFGRLRLQATSAAVALYTDLNFEPYGDPNEGWMMRAVL